MQFLILLLRPHLLPIPPYISPLYGICPFYCLNAEKQRDTIKTSVLSVTLTYLLNLFLHSALLFFGP